MTEKIPMIGVKIEREEDEEWIAKDAPVNRNPDPIVDSIKELTEKLSTIRKARRLLDITVQPETLGYVECPTCGYYCEGLFEHNT